MPAKKAAKKVAAKKAAKKPAKKAAKKAIKRPAKSSPRKGTVKQEVFLESYFSNGFNGKEAARTAGYKGNDNTLKSIACENLTKPYIASRVRERLDGLQATSDEVLNLLADHLRADLADFQGCFDDDGRLDLVKAQEKGVSRLVKKYKTTTRSIPRGKDEEPMREVTTEIELYSAQDAGAKLIPVLGLKQRPRDNEVDAVKRREFWRKQIERVMLEQSLGEDSAKQWLLSNVTRAREEQQYIN